MSCLSDDVHVGIINEPDVIFGKFDVAKDYILINHILLLGKYYIYSRKLQNSLYLHLEVLLLGQNVTTESRPLKSVARENANKLEMTHRACVT